MLKPKRQIAKYIFFDYIAAMTAWSAFYFYRKIAIELPQFGEIHAEINKELLLGTIFLPVIWVLFYYLTGQYQNPYYRSRLKELGHTISTTIVGSTIIFFALILDDYIETYKDYYSLYLILILFHFVATYIPRLAITATMIKKIRSGKIGFNTIFIGGGEKALNFYKNNKEGIRSSGLIIKGFVAIYENSTYQAEEVMTHLGYLKDIHKIITENDIHEVIIASEAKEQERVEAIIHHIEFINVKIKLMPDLFGMFTGKYVTPGVYKNPLLEISHNVLPAWQENTKRFTDIIGSLICMVILSPAYIFLAIGVKQSSKGPILYSHERIGKNGKPFKIYKFRSMFVDAEKNGPMLSSNNDSRITKFGLFMRRTRLDEIPQFFNVLIGNMSIVGPRPERQFYIEQIVQRAPHYKRLLKVRPGITSWGQVKYGYAENVDQMVERLKYDLIYIENMSIYFDLKIMIYTVKTILEGSGK